MVEGARTTGFCTTGLCQILLNWDLSLESTYRMLWIIKPSSEQTFCGNWKHFAHDKGQRRNFFRLVWLNNHLCERTEMHLNMHNMPKSEADELHHQQAQTIGVSE